MNPLKSKRYYFGAVGIILLIWTGIALYQSNQMTLRGRQVSQPRVCTWGFFIRPARASPPAPLCIAPVIASRNTHLSTDSCWGTSLSYSAWDRKRSGARRGTTLEHAREGESYPGDGIHQWCSNTIGENGRSLSRRNSSLLHIPPTILCAPRGCIV